MAASADLLVRDHVPRPWLTRTVAVVAVLLVAAVWVFHRSHATASTTRITVTTSSGSGQPAVRTIAVTAHVSRALASDVAHLTQGRIPCGAPGPADVVIAFRTASYDVNGECARVVRLPEVRGGTVWLESAALHDDLASLIGT